MHIFIQLEKTLSQKWNLDTDSTIVGSVNAHCTYILGEKGDWVLFMKLHCVLPAVPDSTKYIKVQVFNNTKHRVYVHSILFVE
jgi:hypothetical protein